MIPVLYDESLTPPRSGHAAIENLGKGKVAETVSCTIHEELNGDHYLELKYPVTGVLYSELMNGGTILVHCPRHPTGGVDRATRGFDLFDIRKKSLPIDGVVTFTAQHISRRLSKAVVTSRFNGTYSNPPFRYSVPNSFDNIEFIMNDEMGTSTWITPTAPRSALACLVGDEESIVSTFGGDIVFPCYYYSGRYNIEVHAIWDNVGEDRGASVRFGVNMMNIDHTKDSTSAYNAVVPYWDDGNGNITYVTGYIVQPTTPITPVMAVPLDLSNDFDSQPTEAQMVQAARDHLDNLQPWLGEETIKVDVLDDITDPHAPEILLGDTIHVYWGDADIATDLRVVAYDYDVLAERYISLELGTPQTQYVAVTGESYAGASGGGGGGKVASVDFTDQCTFPKGTPAHFSAVALGDLAVVSYQGPSLSTYAAQDVLVRVPAEYAFNVTKYGQQFNLCTFNTQGVGTILIGNNAGRDITLNGKPTTTGNVRCYFQIIYTIGS